MMHPLKNILIVDDHPIVRKGLKLLLEMESGFAVPWEAEGTDDALAILQANSVDFIIVDVTLKDSSGLNLIKEIRDLPNESPILVLSMHDEDTFAERSLKAGANGYLMKQEPPEMVVRAIKGILGGEVYLSEKMSKKAVQMLSGKKGLQCSPLDILSEREFEIFQMIGQGLTNWQIAEKLDLSKKTIDTYREKIKSKLNLESANRLVLYAFKWSQK